jgi:hypothetical protein
MVNKTELATEGLGGALNIDILQTAVGCNQELVGPAIELVQCCQRCLEGTIVNATAFEDFITKLEAEFSPVETTRDVVIAFIVVIGIVFIVLLRS